MIAFDCVAPFVANEWEFNGDVENLIKKKKLPPRGCHRGCQSIWRPANGRRRPLGTSLSATCAMWRLLIVIGAMDSLLTQRRRFWISGWSFCLSLNSKAERLTLRLIIPPPSLFLAGACHAEQQTAAMETYPYCKRQPESG